MSAGPARRALNHSPPAKRGEMPQPAPAQGQAAVPTHRCGCIWPSGGGLPPSLLPPLRRRRSSDQQQAAATGRATDGAAGHTRPRPTSLCPPASVTPALSVIPAEAGIHAICGVKGTPNVRRRPITRGALGALVGRRADGGSSHGWAVAWIPASAGMTEGRARRNGGRMGMAEVVEMVEDGCGFRNRC